MISTPRDEYDEFLDTFDPTAYPALMHASMPQYVDDDLARQRLIATACKGEATLERESYQEGEKLASEEEARLKCLDFFKLRQAHCNDELRGRLLEDGLSPYKIDTYFDAIATLWIQARSIRLRSPEMRAIIASVACHDREYYPAMAGKFVANSAAPDVVPLLTPEEIASVFAANRDMMENEIFEYFKAVGNESERSINRIFARRGMYRAGSLEPWWREEEYLSSYSLMLTVVESFSRTWRPSNKAAGKPTITRRPCQIFNRG